MIHELEKKHEYLDELLPVLIRDDYRSAIEEDVDPAELKEAIADIGYDSLDAMAIEIGYDNHKSLMSHVSGFSLRDIEIYEL